MGFGLWVLSPATRARFVGAVVVTRLEAGC